MERKDTRPPKRKKRTRPAPAPKQIIAQAIPAPPIYIFSQPLFATPPQEEGWGWQKIAPLVASGVAFILSLASFLYTRKKDQKARAQSIRDDYWLRKVISPITIEPMMKQLLELAASIPADCSEEQFSPEEIQKFSTSYSASHITFSSNMMALAILDNSLYASALNCLDEIEEAVVEYCGMNGSMQKTPEGAPVATKEALRESLRAGLMKLLEKVRTYQSELR